MVVVVDVVAAAAEKWAGKPADGIAVEQGLVDMLWEESVKVFVKVQTVWQAFHSVLVVGFAANSVLIIDFVRFLQFDLSNAELLDRYCDQLVKAMK